MSSSAASRLFFFPLASLICSFIQWTPLNLDPVSLIHHTGMGCFPHFLCLSAHEQQPHISVVTVVKIITHGNGNRAFRSLLPALVADFEEPCKDPFSAVGPGVHIDVYLQSLPLLLIPRPTLLKLGMSI